MKKVVFVLSLVLAILSAKAQIENPVHWKFGFQKSGEKEGYITATANIDKGWHVYSQFIEEGGPIPTSFKFSPSGDYSLIGKITESPKPVTAFDPNFNMKIAWHEKQVVFKQKVSIKKAGTVKGSVEFMVCNDRQCLPPTEEEFTVKIEIPVAVQAAKKEAEAPVGNNAVDTPVKDTSSTATLVQAETPENTPSDTTGRAKPVARYDLAAETKTQESFWGIFIAGFLGGLAAFFMPCIYPMIPLTVSFFTKRAGSRSKGIQSAIIYGISIIAVYVALGLLITLIFGASALNEAASSATFNLIFFVVLVVFAVSFLGAFDITLPASLVNKMDEKSNASGLAGLFFMAFTSST